MILSLTCPMPMRCSFKSKISTSTSYSSSPMILGYQSRVSLGYLRGYSEPRKSSRTLAVPRHVSRLEFRLRKRKWNSKTTHSTLSNPCIVAFTMLYVKCCSWTDDTWTFPPYGPLRLYGSRSGGSQESPSRKMWSEQKERTLSRTLCRIIPSMGLPKKILRRVCVLGTI